MRVALNPFYSQQNKVMGRFLLGSCGATKMLKFIAEQLRKQGHGVDFVIPDPATTMTNDWSDFSQWARQWGVDCHAVQVPINNPEQRFHFDAGRMSRVLRNDNLVINWHEFHAFPIRQLFPNIKLIHYNGPFCDDPWPSMSPMFHLNWTAPDLLVGHNAGMMQHMHDHARQNKLRLPRTSTWPMHYRAGTFEVPGVTTFSPAYDDRDIDVLFIQRSSSTNYTYHWQFLDALKILRSRGWNCRVVTTDPTSYLRGEAPESFYEKEYGLELMPPPKTDAAYARLLLRCKAMFLLNPNSDLAYREALYLGVCPIVGDLPAFTDSLGPDWPHRVPVTGPGWDPRAIAGVMERAMPSPGDDPWPAGDYWKPSLRAVGKLGSFESAWDRTIDADIKEVMAS